MGRQDICLGIASREREEVKLTSQKHRDNMMRQKV
jgi:hypothetical protein